MNAENPGATLYRSCVGCWLWCVSHAALLYQDIVQRVVWRRRVFAVLLFSFLYLADTRVFSVLQRDR